MGAKKRKRNFWLDSVGEFILIFLGILVALQGDNWNQSRLDRKLEGILLSEVRSNLKADLEDMEFNIKMEQQYLNTNQIALDFLQSSLPWHDSLGRHFARLLGGSVFDNNNSAYESLNSIGIDLVRNDGLRQQISLVNEVRYPKVDATQELLYTHIFDHLYPSIRANLHTVILREKSMPVNLEELRRNNGFTEDLYMTIFIYTLSIRTFEGALEERIKLMADIEEELGMDPGDST